MRKTHRHCVVRVPRPPGFAPSSPTDIPAELIAIPRCDLGRAAAEAARLNSEEMAKGNRAEFVYLPVKAFAGLRSLRRSSPPAKSDEDAKIPAG